MAETTETTNVETPAEANGANGTSTTDHKPTKPLPTTRAKAEKQLEFLRAIAAASGKDRTPVQNTKVADIANVSVSTISSCNAFFVDVKLIESAGGRGYIPSAAVLEFHRQHEWTPETSARKLAPVFQATWFWEALGGRLSFRPLTDDQAIDVLAEASMAGPAYKSQLAIIVDFLELVGLVERENGSIKRTAPQPGGVTDVGLSDDHRNKLLERKPVQEPAPTPQNCMSISMNLAVSMDVLSKWNDPTKVKEFFEQWGNLVSAKAKIESMVKE